MVSVEERHQESDDVGYGDDDEEEDGGSEVGGVAFLHLLRTPLVPWGQLGEVL